MRVPHLVIAATELHQGKMRSWLLVAALCVLVTGKSTPNPEFNGDAPMRTPLNTDAFEVRDALRYVMTELKRLNNKYRYASLKRCHSASAAAANFDGRNVFLDVEFDMLRGQPSRHDIIVFKDEARVITGMAIDEFPDVKLREPTDPDV